MVSRRSFTAEDQVRFARWSGDWNPMHVDEVAARRTVAGTVVVHGVHLLLWMLDEVAACCGGRRPGEIEVRFLRFVPVGQVVEMGAVREGPGGVEVAATLGGVPAVALSLRWVREEVGVVPGEVGGVCDVGVVPLVVGWDELSGRRGAVGVGAEWEGAASAYPGAVRLISAERVGGLAAATRLVGMVCPGLHSVFAALRVALVEGEAAPVLRYAVQALDARFRTVALGIAGFGMVGVLKTLMRPAPVAQPGVAALREVVRAGEFAGTTALVVGGSRGLGELTAKLVAAGGGDCVLSYASGVEDAARVAEEIRAAGRGCRVVRMDATAEMGPQLAAVGGGVTQAYYFATTKIFRQGGAGFDVAAFEGFCRVYVAGFEGLCAGLAGGAGVSVFYPSSVAVETRPRGMTEYAMAKAAGEVLCRDLDRWMPGVRVVMRRLPRLSTDQTATTSPVRCEDAVGVMLGVVRAMRDVD